MVQGAKALVALAGAEDVPPAALELIQSIQVQAQGTRLSVQLDVPFAALLQLLGEALEEHGEPSGHGDREHQDARGDGHHDDGERHVIRHVDTRREVRRDGSDG